MGLLRRLLEGTALGIGIILGFYIFASIGFLGISEFIESVASKIGGLFSGIGN